LGARGLGNGRRKGYGWGMTLPSRIIARPLEATAFARFGDVIAPKSAPDKLINAGMCGRHHDLARLDFSDGQAGISLFDAKARNLPLRVDLLERHPAGSQAFLPLNGVAMIVVVAEDDGGPTRPQAFITAPGEGVNLLRGTWHGVLAPLGSPGQYAVVDRIGAGANLEEVPLDPPLWVDPPA